MANDKQDTEGNSASRDEMHVKVTKLQTKVAEREKSGLAITESKFEAAFTKLAQSVSSSFFEVWGRKKQIMAKSFRNAMESHCIPDNEMFQEEKITDCLIKHGKYTEEWYQEQENYVNENYVKAMGKTIQLNINFKYCNDLINELNSLYKQHEGIVDTLVDETEVMNNKKPNNQQEGRSCDEKEESIEGQTRKMTDQNVKVNLKDCENIFCELLELRRKIEVFYNIIREENKRLKDFEQEEILTELRYTSGEILYIYQIICRALRQKEQIVEEIKLTLNNLSQLELRIRELLSINHTLVQVNVVLRKSRRDKLHMEKWEIPKATTDISPKGASSSI